VLTDQILQNDIQGALRPLWQLVSNPVMREIVDWSRRVSMKEHDPVGDRWNLPRPSAMIGYTSLKLPTVLRDISIDGRALPLNCVYDNSDFHGHECAMGFVLFYHQACKHPSASGFGSVVRN
jgi:hypothetical protein